MSKPCKLYIIIKYHYNPTSSEVGKRKKLPVLMLDSNEAPLEFDSKKSAQEFVDIMNINTNQGFHYEVKELGNRYLKVSPKQLLKD